MDCVVIGAGVAGLAAAQMLRQAGLEVVVLEARDRIGGRLHTLRPEGWPVPVEAGAEFVHGKPEALLPLAREARPIHGTHYQTGLRSAEGLWESVMEKLGKLPSRPEQTVEKALRTLRFRLRTSKDERELAAAFIEGFNAARLDRASAKAIVQQTRHSEETGGEAIARMPRGYDVVPRRLSKGVAIELRTRVREVVWRKGAVRVVADARTFEAERAIVTLPLGVLQRGAVRFTPRLPDWKRHAIAALAMGPVIKIALLFDDPVWPDDLAFLHARGAPVPTFWRALPSRAPVLIGWAASRDAEQLTRKTAAAAAVRSLSFALGRKVRPKDAIVCDWQDDPLAFGAYSWVPVGALRQQRVLARAAPPLHFAGEATHYEGACGTVHGAIESGQRAAREILKAGAR